MTNSRKTSPWSGTIDARARPLRNTALLAVADYPALIVERHWNNRAFGIRNAEAPLTSFEPCYNDSGLRDTSYITSHILQYNSSLLTITLYSMVRTAVVYNDT